MTMNNHRDFLRGHRTSLLVLASTLLMTPAFAQTGDGSVETETSHSQRVWERLSQKFDQNQDGQITADEVPEAERFARMDRNGDQVVTEADFEGIEHGPRGRRGHRGQRGPGLHMMIGAADANQDGQVAADEWNVFVGSIDADGDGLLTETELTAHREAHHKALGLEKTEGVGHREGRRHHPKAKAFMDSDGDGQLETEDLTAAFSKMDRNGDGFLSEADRPSRGQGKARGERKRGRRGPRIAGHLMHQADINQDQQLTQAEWTGYLATLDSNTDGLLSRDELAATRPADAPEPPRHAEGFEPPALEVSRLTEGFARRDADSNGIIEGDEWQRRGHRGERGERMRMRRGADATIDSPVDGGAL